MNITRYALSIALLFSVSAISAETEVTTENTEIAENSERKTVSVDELMDQIAAEFKLSNEEMAQLRALLESASTEDGEIDVAALIDALRTADNDAATDEKEVVEDTQEPAEAVDSDTQD